MNKLLLNIICVVAITFSMNVKAQDIYRLKKTTFNQKFFDDYAPSFFDDGRIVYISNVKNDFFAVYRDQNKSPLSDIYVVNELGDDQWSKPVLFSEELSTKFNEGPCCFNSDGTEMIFTRNRSVEKNKSKKKNNVFLFSSKLEGGTWSEPKALSFCRGTMNYAHPHLADNDSTLYFTSNTRGKGKNDIFISTLAKGRWSKPVNIGDVINTRYSEIYPYYHKESERLYFASNRVGGEGAYDIYYSTFFNGVWNEPVALPPPFNSNKNDYAIILSTDLKSGYFSSSRSASDNIYHFNYAFPGFDQVDSLQVNERCYVFYDKGSGDLSDYPYKYEWTFGDGNKVIGPLEVDHCYEREGKYKIELNVIDTITKETLFNQAERELVHEDIEQVFITSHDTTFVGEELKLDGHKTNLKGVSINSYIWELGDGNVGTGVETQNIYYEPGLFRVLLGIRGTDFAGQAVSKAVYKYIVVLENPNEE